MRLNGFGFWVESLTQVKLLLAHMQKAVAIAKEFGYATGKVRVYDGVHERDTGYEVFSQKTYSSFEEAKEKLPIDFANEQKAGLDGLWFTTLNFEFFEVELSKNGVPSVLVFSRGELTAPDELHTVYASADWTMLPCDR